MIDGVSGVDLLAGFMAASATRPARAGSAAPDARARPGAGAAPRRRAGAPRHASLEGGALRRSGSRAGPRCEPPRGAATRLARSGARCSRPWARPRARRSTATVGPHRRFDWTRMDLRLVRELKTRLGGTVNDVVLAVVAGAMRRFLERRGVATEGLDFRAMLPVSVRTPEPARQARQPRRLPDRAPPGGRGGPAQALRARASRRLAASRRRTSSRAASCSRSSATGRSPTLVARLSRLAAPHPLLQHGRHERAGAARARSACSARGSRRSTRSCRCSRTRRSASRSSATTERLFWGFNADWDAIPDLHELVRRRAGGVRGARASSRREAAHERTRLRRGSASSTARS